MRAAFHAHEGLSVGLGMLVVAAVLGALIATSGARGGDAAAFIPGADRTCAAAEQALAKLQPGDVAGARRVLEREYEGLRALRLPGGQWVQAGHFIALRGRELTQARAVAWSARRTARGRKVAVPVVVPGGASAGAAAVLGLTDCAKRGALSAKTASGAA